MLISILVASDSEILGVVTEGTSQEGGRDEVLYVEWILSYIAGVVNIFQTEVHVPIWETFEGPHT